MGRTRIKICGLTREEDVRQAVGAGADAIGFLTYPKSPRYVGPERVAALAAVLPPFVTPVLLCVNASRDEVGAYLDVCPNAILQFHGDESAHECEQFDYPYVKAARIRADGTAAGVSLAEFCARYASARAILVDAYSETYGGTGTRIDWDLLATMPSGFILSGGLDADNVAEGIARLHPWAVDVSSGVEKSKGVKDAGKMTLFCQAVRAADRAIAGE